MKKSKVRPVRIPADLSDKIDEKLGLVKFGTLVNDLLKKWLEVNK